MLNRRYVLRRATDTAVGPPLCQASSAVLILSHRPLDIPSPPSQSQSNYSSRSVVVPLYLSVSLCSPPLGSLMHSGASSSYNLLPVGPTSNDCEPPTPSSAAYPPSSRAIYPPSSNAIHPPSSSVIYQPHTSHEQTSFPRVQRAEMPAIPSHSPIPPQHLVGFFAVPRSSGTPPVPRLRPASWNSPSQVDETPEGYRPTQPSPQIGFRGDVGYEEDLPFGGRTLPPLPVANDPWRSGVQSLPDTGPTSYDHPTGSEDLSTTNSLPSTSFPTNFPDGEYRYSDAFLPQCGC